MKIDNIFIFFLIFRTLKRMLKNSLKILMQPTTRMKKILPKTRMTWTTTMVRTMKVQQVFHLLILSKRASPSRPLLEMTTMMSRTIPIGILIQMNLQGIYFFNKLLKPSYAWFSSTMNLHKRFMRSSQYMNSIEECS